MKIVDIVFNTLFPPRLTAKQVAEITPAQLMTAYEPRMISGTVALTSYRDSRIRACVHELKFHNNERAVALLAELLGQWLRTNVPTATLIVPIPLSSARYRARGYNQVTRIAQTACREHKHCIFDEHILIRTRNTQPQTELAREKRALNVHGAFDIRNARAAARVRNMPILLLDDVSTTGATLQAARMALQKYEPASIQCIALAH